jgi:CHASE2 domain-containing sensor protein
MDSNNSTPLKEKKKILILAANPEDNSNERLGQELRDIAEGLRRAQKRDQFVLEQRLAVRPIDIQRAILEFKPHIVHFSGRGAGEEGLVFEDETGQSKLVSGSALAELFKLFVDTIECVVINGCYSQEQAKAIAQHIDYVIGMSEAIEDQAAIKFAVGFYDALGAGRSIEFAYRLGCSAIQLEGIKGHLTPVLLKKPKVLFLYSQRDEELKNKLKQHLDASLDTEKVILYWCKCETFADSEHKEELENHLNTVHGIFLLVSLDFLAAKNNWQTTVAGAMERYKQKEAYVIPILLHACVWDNMPFSELQALPKNKLPITSWQNENEAFTNIVQSIRQTVKEISGLKEETKYDKQLTKIKKVVRRIPWKVTFLTTTVVTTLVIAIRLLGIFQASELWFYDQMMRFQSSEDPDNRLLIVRITSQDIKKYGRTTQQNQGDIKKASKTSSLDDNTPKYGASLPDGIIFKLLSTLLENKPIVIGIDLYRNFRAYDPRLAKLFKDKEKSQHLIFICKKPDLKSINDGYDAPLDIPEEQIGFSDFLVDDDGVIRRQLLKMGSEEIKDSNCNNNKKIPMDSFGFKLAQQYLNTTKNKQFNLENDIIKYNSRIILQPLDSDKQGGFNFKNLNGYQVLLKYRLVNENNSYFLVPNENSPYNIARTVTVDDILDKKNLGELVKDKIVLIGTTTESYDNVSPIPGNRQMWNLFIEAQQVSQIVSAVVDNPPRRLLTAGSLEHEILCILSCALMGAILPHLCQGTRKLIIVGGILIIVLCTMSLVLFSTKLWLPVTSSAMALFISGGVVIFVEFKIQKNLKKSKFT